MGKRHIFVWETVGNLKRAGWHNLASSGGHNMLGSSSSCQLTELAIINYGIYADQIIPLAFKLKLRSFFSISF